MAVVDLHGHPILLKYRASICSKATVFIVIVFLFTIITPFLIAYRSEGFWMKEAFYREQPEVHFKHQVILLLGMRDGSFVSWSTYSNLNLLQQSSLRIPVVKTREEDSNRDGKKDKLHFNLEVPVSDSQDVISVQMILVFDYRLHRFSSLRMESLGYIQYTSFLSGAKLVAEGELRLQLKQPLAHKGVDTRYNVPIVNEDSIFVEDYTFSNIFSNYISRNVTTSFECKYPIWISSRGAGQPFVIQGSVSYPEELIVYIPGFWQTIKMGWVQYLSILVVFIFLMEKVKTFVFENDIVQTVIVSPVVTKNHAM